MRFLILVGLFIAAFAGSASAEIALYDSVEWFCARSEIVARGTLIALSPEEPSRQQGKDEGLVSLTLRPVQLLKGAGTLAPIHFSMRVPDTRQLVAWKKGGTELVGFLRRTVQAYRKDGIDYSLWPVRETGSNVQALVEFARPQMHLFSAAEMVPVTTAAQLAAACSRGGPPAAKGEEPKGPHLLEVPGESPIYQTLYSGSSCYLNVPVGVFAPAKPSLGPPGR